MESNTTCSFPGCSKAIFNKKQQLCQAHYQQKRRDEIAARQNIPSIPADVIERMAKARTQEDWLELAGALTPVLAAIMQGKIVASAAQVSLIKDVMNRAYGKPTNKQDDKDVALGTVFLPVIGKDHDAMTCPQCTFNALELVQDDSTRELAVKILKDLLNRLIAKYSPPQVAG